MAGQVKPIPVPVILAAVNGDENALAAVVAHYQKYIRALATRPVKDEYGNEYLYVDEDMRLRLETKLIHSIVTGFKVLPGFPLWAICRSAKAYPLLMCFCRPTKPIVL